MHNGGLDTASTKRGSKSENGFGIVSQSDTLLSKLISRALNKNQIFLLQEISKNKGKTATGLIEEISRENKIPVSTLKLNTKILKGLELINFFNGDPVRLTGFGRFVFSLVSISASQNGVTGNMAGCKSADPSSNPGSETGGFL